MRLYYDNAYLSEFTSHVTGTRTDARGTWIALEDTAFYPESGGQPSDRGQIGDAEVRDVQVDDTGVVWHLVASPVEGRVTGRIDFERRLDHMQQHAAQHIATQAALRVLGRDTVGFHIGDAVSTFDLVGRTAPGSTELHAVEDLVNQVITEDRPILARFVSDEELGNLALRRPPKVDGPVRVVTVADFDQIPCGGTHPRSTAELGLVRLFPMAPEHDGFRIGYLAGGRARRDYRLRATALDEIGRLLSIPPLDAPNVLSDRLAQETEMRRGLDRWRRVALDAEARELAKGAAGGGVLLAMPGRDAQDLRDLALRLARLGVPAALVGGSATGSQIAVARPAGAGPHVGETLRAFAAAMGGRGGGSDVAAQAAFPQGPEVVLQEFASRMAALTGA